MSKIINLGRINKIPSPSNSRQRGMILPDSTVDNIIILIISRRSIVFITSLSGSRGLRDVFFGSGDANEVDLGVFPFAANRTGDGEGVGGDDFIRGDYFDLE